jgi:hypothetical protein
MGIVALASSLFGGAKAPVPKTEWLNLSSLLSHFNINM